MTWISDDTWDDEPLPAYTDGCIATCRHGAAEVTDPAERDRVHAVSRAYAEQRRLEREQRQR